MSTIYLGNGEKILISLLTERNENTISETLSFQGINLLMDLKEELNRIDFNKVYNISKAKESKNV